VSALNAKENTGRAHRPPSFNMMSIMPATYGGCIVAMALWNCERWGAAAGRHRRVAKPSCLYSTPLQGCSTSDQHVHMQDTVLVMYGCWWTGCSCCRWLLVVLAVGIKAIGNMETTRTGAAWLASIQCSSADRQHHGLNDKHDAEVTVEERNRKQVTSRDCSPHHLPNQPTSQLAIN
jgi:hypothetical protein